jgi:hypothetical protein
VNEFVMNIPALNATASNKYTLDPNDVQGWVPTGTCPPTYIDSDTSTTCVELKNTTSAVVRVSVWTSQATGGQQIDTTLAVYDGAVIPSSTAAWENCLGTVADKCDVAPCPTTGDWAGLTSWMSPPSPVTIAANNSVIACTQVYNGGSASGDFMLNVKREQ